VMCKEAEVVFAFKTSSWGEASDLIWLNGLIWLVVLGGVHMFVP
jgi:hypothetical protein